jgi:NAD(P)H-flavin reductase
MAVLRGLALEAVAGGRQVLVLAAAATVAQVYPSSLLPDEVEYAVATQDGSLGHPGHVVDLLAGFEAWADRCYAAAAPDLLADLAAFASGRDARLGVARLGRRPGRRPAPVDPAGARRRAWLQVALPLDVACVLGVCLGCLVPATDGWRRACREGPAFASGELAWEERP